MCDDDDKLEQTYNFPEHEPGVPCIYLDGWDFEYPVGYSTTAPNYETLLLKRKPKETGSQAWLRFLSVATKRGLKSSDGVLYWNTTHWYWRCVPR